MDMDAASEVRSASDQTWHAMTTDEVIKRLNTNAAKGLDAGEVASRLQKYGSNRLPEGTKRGPFSGSCRSSTTSWSTSCSAPVSPS